MKFIDMFGGIGGFSLGLERNHHECVGYYEWDKRAVSVYSRNFRTRHETTDITQLPGDAVPDHDILCAGFPCQAFSIAGKRRGFEDQRGTLFFEIARIAEAKKPRYLFLENVRGLLSHDGGASFLAIIQRLDDLGYFVEWQVHNSKNHGVPQNRERVFIIGHLGGEPSRKIFPLACCNSEIAGDVPESRQVSTCLDANYQKGWLDHGQRTMILSHSRDEHGTVRGYNVRDEAGTLKQPSGNQTNYLIELGLKELTKNVPDAYRVYSADGVARTLKGESGGVGGKTGLYAQGAYVHGGERALEVRDDNCASTLRTPGGGKNLCVQPVITPDRLEKRQNGRRIKDHNDPMFALTVQDRHRVYLDGAKIRRLTPTECERLQGFPDGWTAFGQDGEPMSDSARYKMLGNAVTVNVIEDISRGFTCG